MFLAFEFEDRMASSRKYPHFEGDEVLEGGYGLRTEGKEPYKRRPPSERVIDDLNPVSILGGARAEWLLARTPWEFARKGLRALLGRDPPKVLPVEPGESRTVSVSPTIRNNQDQLIGTDAEPRILRSKRDDEEAKEFCGMFDVDKKDQLDDQGRQKVRVVFNAVPGNAKLAHVEVTLLLFLLVMLLGAFTEICQSGGYCLNYDMRHMYYQWPWSSEYARYFTVQIEQRLYIPRVLIMGYHSACAICQCALWAVILHRDPGDDPLGVDDNEISPDGNMPRMIWLYHDVGGKRVRAGAIFALLDGIFIFTRERGLRDAWKKRIDRNISPSYANVFKKEQGANNELSDNGDNIMTFSGIEFKAGTGFRPAKRENLQLSAYTTVEHFASLVGILLWSSRVRLLNLLDYSGLLDVASAVGARIQNPEERKQPMQLTRQQRAHINALISERSKSTYCWMSQDHFDPADVVILAATDATRTTRAHVIFDGTGQVVSFSPVAAKPSAGSKRDRDDAAAAAAAPDSEECEGNRAEQVHQEFEAVVELTEQIASPGRRVQLLVAVDADPVRQCIAKNYSKTPKIREYLRRIQRTGVRVFATRIRSEGNLADLPSRGKDPEDEARRVETFAVIQKLRSELLARDT